jgi:hypothetical protein
MICRHLLLLKLAMLVLGPGPALAQVTESILSVENTNPGSNVIDSDASNPGAAWNRDTLRVVSRVQSTSAAAGTQNASYTLSYRLLDANGQPHPIYNAAGVTTNTGYTHTVPVDLFLNGRTPVTRTNTALLRPFARLSPHQQYTVELQVRKNPFLTSDTATGAPRTYYHFRSQSSGDVFYNVITTADSATLAQAYAVRTDPAKNAFLVDVDATLRRYDNFAGSHLPADDVTVRFTWELRDAESNAVIPLATSTSNIVVSLFKHDPPPPLNPLQPLVQPLSQTLLVQPADGTQLDPVQRTYRIEVTIAHRDQAVGPIFTPGNTIATPNSRLLHFSGTLLFGALETRFTSIDNDPGVISVVAGSHVNTRLGVDSLSGFVVANPALVFGTGTDLAVRLRSTGTAELSSGSVPVNAPPQSFELSQVRVQLVPPLALDPEGLKGSLRVFFPTGSGYRLDTASHFLRSSILFDDVLLGANLRPTAASLVFNPAGGLFVAEDTRPFWFPATRLTWEIAQGRFRVQHPSNEILPVRRDEYTALAAAAAQLASPSLAVKRSNDRVHDAATAAAGVFISANAQGTAVLTANITLGNGDFRTHFPWDTRVQWNNGGQNAVVLDATVAPSVLRGVDDLSVSYSRGCVGDDCPGDPAPASPGLEPGNGELFFTPDGGLVGAGPLTEPTRIQWGRLPSGTDFAHEAYTFANGTFHMPGTFLGGAESGLAPHLRPGVLLLSGVVATNPLAANRLERRDTPGTPNDLRYEAGLADYAGLNVRVTGEGTHQGASILGGTPTGPYPLKPNAKYYVRYAGVSGIHDVPASGFPDSLTIYGYAFDVANFAFNLLDNRPRESLINGLIDLPFPSDFELPFEHLELSCLGALTGADLAGSPTAKALAYWNGSFTPLALDFARNAEDACDPSSGRLVLGVETRVAHVQPLLLGNLGFLPDGNLITHADGLDGVDSRLKLPSVVSLNGPTNEAYQITPSTGAYFNDHRGAADAPVGWVNLASKFDVPFFEDLLTHLHTSANAANPAALIQVMGGWPRQNGADGNQGWVTNGDQHFFNNALFDPSNRGYPTGVVLDNYRASATEQFRPRAHRSWQEIINFSFPLTWSTTTRSFRSSAPVEGNVIVLTTERQVDYLSAQHAELTFGAQFDILPQANLVNIAHSLADQTGIATAVGEAIGFTQRDEIVGGFQQLDELLTSNMEAFFDRVFTEVVDGPIEEVYDALEQRFETEFDFDNPLLWLSVPNDFFATQYRPKIEAALKALPGDLDKGMIHQFSDHLGKAEKALEHVEDAIAKVQDHRTNIVKVVQKLGDFFASDHQAALAADKVRNLLEKSDATLTEIEETLGKLREVLSNIRDHMDDIGNLQFPGGLGIEMKELFDGAGPILAQVANTGATGLQNFLNDIPYNLDSPFSSYTPETLRQQVRQEVMDAFLASPVAADVRQVLKYRLYENDAAAREALDSVFAEVNRLIRALLKTASSQLADNFEGFLDDLGTKVASADIDGYAHINGDSLKELRLDLSARLDVVKPMEFGAFLHIKELDSDGSETCNTDAETYTEVTLGAKDVEIGWFGPGLKLNASHKMTFGEKVSPVVRRLRGMAGSLQLKGELDFQAVTIHTLAAAAAFGVQENYLSGAAGMEINGIDVTGGGFFGSACSLAPIELWDPKAAGAIGAAPVRGFYTYAEGWIPLNQILGIPSSCLFELSGGFGYGWGILGNGPTFIAKLKYGLQGRALCLVDVKGELTGVASVDLFNPVEGLGDGDYLDTLIDNVFDSLTVRGFGKVSGSLGPCPFCLEYSKEIGFTFKDRRWKLHF